MLKHQCNEIGSGEWFEPGKEFIGNAAQGILVTLPANLTLKLLRCHVVRGASDGGLFDTRCRQDGGDAEVCQQRFSFGIEEDIFWFEVTMNDILLMGILERLTDL